MVISNALPVPGAWEDLDNAHVKGLLSYLAGIGHNPEVEDHLRRASSALTELPAKLARDVGPDYNDPYVAAAYIVKYHLSHCALAYWAFNGLFELVGVPPVMYVCDLGAGTGAGRVGLALALLGRPNQPVVYFDAVEPSSAMLAAGDCFWRNLTAARQCVPDVRYRQFNELPSLFDEIFGISEGNSDMFERIPDNALSILTAFHLSLPYDDADEFNAWARSREVSAGSSAIAQAISLMSPNVGIFTGHSSKSATLTASVDWFPYWSDELVCDIPQIRFNSAGAASDFAPFYTDVVEDLGFNVMEGTPVHRWSWHRFSPPQGTLLLRRTKEKSALEIRNRRLADEKILAEKRELERQEQIAKERIESERAAEAARLESKRLAEEARLEAERLERARQQQIAKEKFDKEEQDRLWGMLESCKNSGERIYAKITGINPSREGLFLEWDGLTGYGYGSFSNCPDIANTGMSDSDLGKLSGRAFTFRVLDTHRRRGYFEVTRENEQQNPPAEGDIVQTLMGMGKIRRVRKGQADVQIPNGALLRGISLSKLKLIRRQSNE